MNIFKSRVDLATLQGISYEKTYLAKRYPRCAQLDHKFKVNLSSMYEYSVGKILESYFVTPPRRGRLRNAAFIYLHHCVSIKSIDQTASSPCLYSFQSSHDNEVGVSKIRCPIDDGSSLWISSSKRWMLHAVPVCRGMQVTIYRLCDTSRSFRLMDFELTAIYKTVLVLR